MMRVSRSASQVHRLASRPGGNARRPLQEVVYSAGLQRRFPRGDNEKAHSLMDDGFNLLPMLLRRRVRFQALLQALEVVPQAARNEGGQRGQHGVALRVLDGVKGGDEGQDVHQLGVGGRRAQDVQPQGDHAMLHLDQLVAEGGHVVVGAGVAVEVAAAGAVYLRVNTQLLGLGLDVGEEFGGRPFVVRFQAILQPPQAFVQPRLLQAGASYSSPA
jgi:hypothetical protein